MGVKISGCRIVRVSNCLVVELSGVGLSGVEMSGCRIVRGVELSGCRIVRCRIVLEPFHPTSHLLAKKIEAEDCEGYRVITGQTKALPASWKTNPVPSSPLGRPSASPHCPNRAKYFYGCFLGRQGAALAVRMVFLPRTPAQKTLLTPRGHAGSLKSLIARRRRPSLDGPL